MHPRPEDFAILSRSEPQVDCDARLRSPDKLTGTPKRGSTRLISAKHVAPYTHQSGSGDVAQLCVNRVTFGEVVVRVFVFPKEIAMKKAFWMAAIASMTVVSSVATAAELPAFELTGFPITPHQVAVVGGTGVREQAPIPALTFGGMPASPHQIAVLTLRSSVMEKAAAVRPTTAGLVAK
jgi:hypothetical protein